jgi:hypothetical protein
MLYEESVLHNLIDPLVPLSYRPYPFFSPPNVSHARLAQVPSREHLTVEVYDYDRVFANDFLGRVTIDVHKEVACAPKGDVTKSWNLQDVPGEFMGEANKPSTITLRLQWIPFAGIHV